MTTPTWVSHLMVVIRPILAVFLVVTLILLGWVVAWKLVLVHVPFVQEVCGLRKKPPEPKPATRRFSHLYNNSSNRLRANPSSKLQLMTTRSAFIGKCLNPSRSNHEHTEIFEQASLIYVGRYDPWIELQKDNKGLDTLFWQKKIQRSLITCLFYWFGRCIERKPSLFL